MRVDPGLIMILALLPLGVFSCGESENVEMQIPVSKTIQAISSQKGIDYGSVYAVVSINGQTQRINITDDSANTVPVSGIKPEMMNDIRVEWWEDFQGSPLMLSHQSGSIFIADTDPATIISFPHIAEPYDNDRDGKTNLSEREQGTCPISQPCAIKEPTMITIPAGSFQMGAIEIGAPETEYPQHPVSIKSFSLAEAEITWSEWDVCVDAGGCSEVARQAWVADLSNPGSHPVGGVSWDQIQGYLGWINRGSNGGYRLPTEAEFEYALRGGTASLYFYGDDNSNFCVYVNGFNNASSCDDGFLRTAPVKSLQANPFGLYDMNGNVGEWTSDCWHTSYIGAPDNGEPWLDEACGEGVLRGGNYLFDSVDFRGSTRRQKTRHPDYPEVQEGFRLARD